MDFTGLEGIAILIHIGDSAHVQHFQFSLNPLCAFQILCPYYSCKKILVFFLQLKSILLKEQCDLLIKSYVQLKITEFYITALNYIKTLTTL